MLTGLCLLHDEMCCKIILGGGMPVSKQDVQRHILWLREKIRVQMQPGGNRQVALNLLAALGDWEYKLARMEEEEERK